MKRISMIEPWSVMKISAIGYGAMGLVEGVMFGFVLTFVPLADKSGGHMPRVFGPIFGILAIVFLPPLFAVFGALMAGIGAAIYNLSAKYVGGIEVEVS
jgi:hypothetical protein